MSSSNYLEEQKNHFIAKHRGEFDSEPELVRDLEQLLIMAKISGAERERCQILDRIRNNSIGVVVEAFNGDMSKLISLSADKLAKELEQ